MQPIFVPLKLTLGVSQVELHPIRGEDELLVEDVSTRTALCFLERLIYRVSPENSLDTFRPSDIVTADRDRIFAELYRSIYGNNIESTITCQSCQSPFDLDFSLQSLLNHYPLIKIGADDEDIFRIGEVAKFRLPTGADELMLAETSGTSPEDFLLSRCMIQGNVKEMGLQVQEKMAEIAPVLNLSMEAHCPDCGADQEVHFDIQTFFLSRLKQEYPQLLKEIHCLAANYHWSSEAILNLPRKLRKQYVALIESEY